MAGKGGRSTRDRLGTNDPSLTRGVLLSPYDAAGVGHHPPENPGPAITPDPMGYVKTKRGKKKR